MAIDIRGRSDEIVDKIAGALRSYSENHPSSSIAIYRQNSVSVRIRVVDPDFVGSDRSQRSQQVWQYLEQLPDEVHGDISTVLLLTPSETEHSFANLEFDDPVPSKL